MMKTYLFTWNPTRWVWPDIQADIALLHKRGWLSNRWSCGNTKSIKRGDRAFLLRLGKEPRGIMASGWVDSDCYEDSHWESNETGKTAIYVKANFNVLLDAEREDILSRDMLNDGILSKMHWDSQSSGVRIPDDIAAQLEILWDKYLLQHPRLKNERPSSPVLEYPDEVDSQKEYLEGSISRVVVNQYERNPEARKACLDFYGSSCAVCGFNFEKVYGNIGKNYIHVHHLKAISEIGKEYSLNPIDDLRPVCPNCHAMIHKTKPPIELSDLKDRMKKQHL